ncbi:MAG: DUF2867 domain-containing protein [Prevotellaceae bacterium]|nr:DUF2867 domain-containing protein [Prevotellaceae bacterium]
MKTIAKLNVIPENSVAANGFGKLHYCDVYQVQRKTEKSAEEIAREVMRLPGWALALFKLRNAIVGIFGLKTDPGEGKSFFSLIEKNDTEIVLGESDKHLDFRLSVMNDKLTGTISLTTLVHFNNVWGRVYFLPVKPFHKIIVKSLMKIYLKI